MRDSALESVKHLQVKGFSLDWMLLADNPFPPVWPDSQRNLAYKLENARKIALRMNYDFLFLHEHDIILPPDTLTKLLAAKADLTTGVTRLRPGHGVGSDLCLLTKVPWIAFDRKTRGEVGYDDRNLSDYKIKVFEGKTFPVEGSGLGCLLVSRHAMKVLPFRWVRANLTLDVIYASMAKRKGVKFVCVGSVQCGHEDEANIVYRIGKHYWNATMILQGNVWRQFKDIKPVAVLKEGRLHLGPRPNGLDWVNYDLQPIEGFDHSGPIDRLKPQLPFEDDFFAEIEIEGFAEKILDKALFLNELWRVSKADAHIRLDVLNDSSDPASLSYWHPDLFDSLSERFKVESQSSKKQRVVWALRRLKGR